MHATCLATGWRPVRGETHVSPTSDFTIRQPRSARLVRRRVDHATGKPLTVTAFHESAFLREHRGGGSSRWRAGSGGCAAASGCTSRPRTATPTAPRICRVFGTVGTRGCVWCIRTSARSSVVAGGSACPCSVASRRRMTSYGPPVHPALGFSLRLESGGISTRVPPLTMLSIWRLCQ